MGPDGNGVRNSYVPPGMGALNHALSAPMSGDITITCVCVCVCVCVIVITAATCLGYEIH